MKNLVIFTDPGNDSDDTLMLMMAREAHLRGDCNVVGVVCSGTHNNRASAAYANWLLNPEWVDIPVIPGHAHSREKQIFPSPSFSYDAEGHHKMILDRYHKAGILHFLLCSPLGDVDAFVSDDPADLKRCNIRLVLMGALKEDGSPDFEKSYNLRADKRGTERVFAATRGLYGSPTFVIDTVIDREECYQYPITEDFYDNKLLENRMWRHHERLVDRNLTIVHDQLPDVWKRVYEGSDTVAIPYDAYTFWKTVYGDEETPDFWWWLKNAVHNHPRAF